MFENDDDDFPLKCPNCGQEFYEKVGRIKTGFQVHCPDNPVCGINFTYRAEEFERLLKNCDNEIRDYLWQFKRLTIR